MTYPTTTISTRLGMIQITATDGNHVHISSGHIARDIPKDEQFIVNGVRYNLSAHFSRYEDAAPSFQPTRTFYGMGAGETTSDRFHEGGSISLRRTDSYADGSEAAVRKVRTELVKMVNEYLATQDGTIMLLQAHRYDFEMKLARAQQVVEDAEQALAAARADLAQLIGGKVGA